MDIRFGRPMDIQERRPQEVTLAYPKRQLEDVHPIGSALTPIGRIYYGYICASRIAFISTPCVMNR